MPLIPAPGSSSSSSSALLGTANVFTALQTIAQAAVNTGILASTGYSLTGSNATSMIDLAGTWNTSGAPTAFKLNITRTAAAATSKLIDLQQGGVTALGAIVNATGNCKMIIGIRGASIDTTDDYATSFGGYFGNIISQNAAGNVCVGLNNFSIGTGADLLLTRKAAATLQLGTDAAGVTNQMFTAASRITSDGVGANLTIAPGNGRGGAGGSLILATFDTQGAGTIGNLQARLTIDTTGLSTFSGNVALGSSAGFTNLGGNSGAVLWQRQDVGMVMFHGQGNNSVGIGSAGYLAGVTIGSTAVLGFSSGIPAAGHDLTVKRASAGTLQIDGGCIVLAGTRTGATLTLSQTWNNAGVTCRGLEFAVTNTNSASGSTLLRILGGAAGATQALALSALHGSLSVGASSNSATISLQGSDRVATAQLGAFGSEFMFGSTQLAANNVSLRFTDANTVVRYGTIFGETTDVLALRNGSGGTTGAAWEMLEMTAPATPAADRLRLYVEDNGSGKTRLVVKFSDGTTTVLATQP